MTYWPRSICFDCGKLYGRAGDGVITVSPGRCDWCEKETLVTAPSDYGYPKPPKDKDHDAK